MRRLVQSAGTTNLPRMASTSCDERRAILSIKSPLGSVRQDHRQARTLVVPRLERLLHWVSVGNTAVGELRDAQLAARAAGQRRWCDRVAIHSRTLLHPGRATRRHPAARLLRIGDPQAISNPKWLFPE